MINARNGMKSNFGMYVRKMKIFHAILKRFIIYENNNPGFSSKY